MKKQSLLKIALPAVFLIFLLLYMANEFYGQSLTLPDFGGFGKGGSLTAFLPTGISVEFNQGSGAAFHTYPGGKGFYFATRDGINYTADNGKTQMTYSYTMQEPVLRTSGQITAVAETGGYELYVFNAQGLLYTKSFTNPIVNFSVNAQGYACAVTKKDGGYESFVYDASGSLKGRSIDADLIVTAADVSPDGRVWAMCYLDTSGTNYSSVLSFAHLNKSESAAYNDSVFASISGANTPALSNQIFCLIRFMDGNNLIIVTESAIHCIDLQTPSAVKWSLPLSNELDAIDFTQTHIAAALGRGLLNRPAEPLGRVLLLNLAGERLLEYDAPARVTHLSCSPIGLITGSGRDFAAFSLKGAPLWTYNAPYDARSVFFLDSTDKALLATSTDASIVKLTKITGGGM